MIIRRRFERALRLTETNPGSIGNLAEQLASAHDEVASERPTNLRYSLSNDPAIRLLAFHLSWACCVQEKDDASVPYLTVRGECERMSKDNPIPYQGQVGLVYTKLYRDSDECGTMQIMITGISFEPGSRIYFDYVTPSNRGKSEVVDPVRVTWVGTYWFIDFVNSPLKDNEELLPLAPEKPESCVA